MEKRRTPCKHIGDNGTSKYGKEKEKHKVIVKHNANAPPEILILGFGSHRLANGNPNASGQKAKEMRTYDPSTEAKINRPESYGIKSGID